MREFKKATEEVKESFEAETNDLEELKDNLTQENLLADLTEDITAATEPATEPPSLEEGSVTSEAATEAMAHHEASASLETPSREIASAPPEETEVGREKKEGPEGEKEGTPSHG